LEAKEGFQGVQSATEGGMHRKGPSLLPETSNRWFFLVFADSQIFLLGLKWTVDLIREWPRKRPISSCFEAARSNGQFADSKAATKTLSHITRIRDEWRRRKIA
jgi:hypothetical protein